MRHYYTIIVFFSLVSCDCRINIEGYIIDKVTRHPISEATIEMVTKNFTKSDFGILYDTLSIDERNEMINKNGNKENWISYGGERMYKRVPLKTDSSGYFELTYIGGFCPEYKLRIKKIGYKEVLVSRDTINPDALEIQLEKQ